jgi:hypothetical protein
MIPPAPNAEEGVSFDGSTVRQYGGLVVRWFEELLTAQQHDWMIFFIALSKVLYNIIVVLNKKG